MKILSINNFTVKLLSKLLSDLSYENSLSLRSLLRSLVVKLLIDNIFIERLGLSETNTMGCLVRAGVYYD